jgi:hypothetical protein
MASQYVDSRLTGCDGSDLLGYGWGTTNTFIGGGDAIEELQANRAQLLLRASGAEGMSPKTSQR